MQSREFPAVRRALEERKSRLAVQGLHESREKRLRRFLESEIWPQVPGDQIGRKLTKEEEEAVLGYGPEGV